MELRDTVELMNSETYWMRFKAEALQLRIRKEKLETLLEKWSRGALDFEPTCPRRLLEKQLRAMTSYLQILEERAEIEGIELWS